MKKTVAAFLILAPLAACVSSATIKKVDAYSKGVRDRVMIGDINFYVAELPEEKSILTTPPFGRQVSQSFTQGVFFNAVKITDKEQIHEAAARAYLDKTGRKECAITSGYMIIEKYYEFTYSCGQPLTPKL